MNETRVKGFSVKKKPLHIGMGRKTPLNALISTERVNRMLCLGIPEVCVEIFNSLAAPTKFVS